jgi:cytochrome d ubiquinol oxidase subunit I
VLFYTALAVVDAILMVRYTKKRPYGLGMWPQVPSPAPHATLAAAH